MEKIEVEFCQIEVNFDDNGLRNSLYLFKNPLTLWFIFFVAKMNSLVQSCILNNEDRKIRITSNSY